MLETERLIIRQFEPSDLDWLTEMRVDPEINKYLGGPRLQNPEAIAKRLDFYMDCYSRFGYGQGAMIWKATGEPIGASGLQPLEETGEVEVGYSLKKDFWRMGLGYECASAWLEYGFNTAGLERIVAVADADNTGSWRIMEKCGMTYEKTEVFYGMPCKFYAISNTEFRSRKADNET